MPRLKNIAAQLNINLPANVRLKANICAYIYEHWPEDRPTESGEEDSTSEATDNANDQEDHNDQDQGAQDPNNQNQDNETTEDASYQEEEEEDSDDSDFYDLSASDEEDHDLEKDTFVYYLEWADLVKRQVARKLNADSWGELLDGIQKTYGEEMRHELDAYVSNNITNCAKEIHHWGSDEPSKKSVHLIPKILAYVEVLQVAATAKSPKKTLEKTPKKTARRNSDSKSSSTSEFSPYRKDSKKASKEAVKKKKALVMPQSVLRERTQKRIGEKTKEVNISKLHENKNLGVTKLTVEEAKKHGFKRWWKAMAAATEGLQEREVLHHLLSTTYTDPKIWDPWRMDLSAEDMFDLELLLMMLEKRYPEPILKNDEVLQFYEYRMPAKAIDFEEYLYGKERLYRNAFPHRGGKGDTRYVRDEPEFIGGFLNGLSNQYVDFVAKYQFKLKRREEEPTWDGLEEGLEKWRVILEMRRASQFEGRQEKKFNREEAKQPRKEVCRNYLKGTCTQLPCKNGRAHPRFAALNPQQKEIFRSSRNEQKGAKEKNEKLAKEATEDKGKDKKQRCPYGAKCKYLPTGNCKYYHPRSDTKEGADDDRSKRSFQ